MEEINTDTIMKRIWDEQKENLLPKTNDDIYRGLLKILYETNEESEAMIALFDANKEELDAMKKEERKSLFEATGGLSLALVEFGIVIILIKNRNFDWRFSIMQLTLLCTIITYMDLTKNIIKQNNLIQSEQEKRISELLQLQNYISNYKNDHNREELPEKIQTKYKQFLRNFHLDVNKANYISELSNKLYSQPESYGIFMEKINIPESMRNVKIYKK